MASKPADPTRNITEQNKPTKSMSSVQSDQQQTQTAYHCNYQGDVIKNNCQQNDEQQHVISEGDGERHEASSDKVRRDGSHNDIRGYSDYKICDNSHSFHSEGKRHEGSSPSHAISTGNKEYVHRTFDHITVNPDNIVDQRPRNTFRSAHQEYINSAAATEKLTESCKFEQQLISPINRRSTSPRASLMNLDSPLSSHPRSSSPCENKDRVCSHSPLTPSDDDLISSHQGRHQRSDSARSTSSVIDDVHSTYNLLTLLEFNKNLIVDLNKDVETEYGAKELKHDIDNPHFCTEDVVKKHEVEEKWKGKAQSVVESSHPKLGDYQTSQSAESSSQQIAAAESNTQVYRLQTSDDSSSPEQLNAQYKSVEKYLASSVSTSQAHSRPVQEHRPNGYSKSKIPSPEMKRKHVSASLSQPKEAQSHKSHSLQVHHSSHCDEDREPKSMIPTMKQNVRSQDDKLLIDVHQPVHPKVAALAAEFDDKKGVRWRSPLVSPASSVASSQEEHVRKANDLEREIRAVTLDKNKAEENIKVLQEKYEQIQYQNGLLREEKADYKHDVNVLINVIGAARTLGRWDVDQVAFRALDYEQVFGKYEEVTRSKSSETILESHIKDLKCELRARDDMIDHLRAELNNVEGNHKEAMNVLHDKDMTITNVTGSLSSSLRREEAATSAATDRDLSIMRLQANMRAAEDRVEDLKKELHMKDQKIINVETSITDLNNEIAVKDSECANHIQTIKVLQDKQRESALEFADCETTIHHLKSELNAMHDHHDKSRHDVTHLDRRTHQLENDLHATQDDKRKLLDEIGALQNKVRDSQVSNHDHHETLKSELGRRDETIQKLRKDVLHFQEKRDAFQTELQKKDDQLRHSERSVADNQRKYEDARNEMQTTKTKFANLEAELKSVRAQHADSLTQIQKLTTSLQKLQVSSKDTRDVLTSEVAERHDAMLKLKDSAKELEEKHRETVTTVNHRGEVIKQLREELRQVTNKVQDVQEHNYALDKELARYQDKYEDSQKEIERLQTYIQEMDLLSSQHAIGHRGEITDREEKIATLSAEIKVCDERMAQQQQQVLHREEQIATLQAELMCKADEVERRDRQLQKMEVDVTNVQEDHRMAVNELERREITLQQVEADLAHSRDQYRDAIEENGRLEARIQAFTINAQSEQDLLSGEVRRREEAMQKLKLDSMHQKENISRLEEQSNQQEKTITQLKIQIKSSQSDVEIKDRTISDFESQLTSTRQLHSETKKELARLEEQHREIQNELGTSSARRENLEHNLTMKEDLIMQLKQDTESLQHQQREAIAKMAARDDAIQRLNAEIGKLRQIRQDKLGEVQRLSDTMKRLQEALTQSHVDLDESRRRADHDISHRDDVIKQLREDLSEAQNQYSQCYDEVMKYEDRLEKLELENDALSDKVGKNATDMCRMEEQIQQQELELTISREKHRTCQQEVANRDQAILKLQTDLDTNQQQYTGALEELGIRDDEVQRLNMKIRQLQSNLRDLQAQLEITGEKVINADKTLQQNENDYQVALQEARNHQRSVDQLKADLTLVRKSHSEETERLQQDIQLLREDLNMAKVDLADNQSQMVQYRQEIESLRDQLDLERRAHADAAAEVEKRDDELQDQDRMLTDSRQQGIILDGQLEHANETVHRLEVSLESYKQKYQSATDQMNNIQESFNSLQDQLADSRNKEHECENENHQLKCRIDQLDGHLTERQAQMTRSESVIEQLTTELNNCQDDLNKALDKLGALERIITDFKEQVAILEHDNLRSEELLKTYQSEYSSYKDQHHHTDSEFQEHAEQIHHLEYDCEEIRSELQIKGRQLHDQQENISELKGELASVREQRIHAENEITRLDGSLEQLQINLASAHQRHRTEAVKYQEQIKGLEADICAAKRHSKQLEHEVSKRDDQLSRSQADLKMTQEELNNKSDDSERLDAVVKELKNELNSLARSHRVAENRAAELHSECEHLKTDLGDARTQYKEATQELAHHEEKLLIMEQSLTTTQEQLSQRVAEVVRLEQNNRKLGTELKTMRERCGSYEEEIDDQKITIDKLRKDLLISKDETHDAVQEGMLVKQQASRLEVELEGSQEQEKMLSSQVEQQDLLLQQLQQELKMERSKQQDTSKQLHDCRKMISDLQEEMDSLQKREREANNKIHEKETQMMRISEDNEGLQQRVRALKEDLAEKDGLLRVANLNLETAQKQHQHHMQEVTKYEDTLAHLHGQLEKATNQYKNSHNQLMDAQQQVHDLKVQLTTLQSNHKETMEQLSDRSKHVVGIKSELDRITQHNHSMSEEIATYEDKMKKLRQELSRVQDHSNQSEEQLHHLEQRFREVQSDFNIATERNKHSLVELSEKEEALVCHKVELSSLHEKHRIKVDENERMRNELDNLRQKFQLVVDESNNLRSALEESRANGERLHRESELVVQNVNQWVREQKHANEKLGNKIREQSKAIVQLSTEKDQLQEQIDLLTKENKRFVNDMDDKKIDYDKFRALQSHSAHQQVLLHQLRNRLEEHENEQDVELKEKLATIEDLHTRLKSNVDSVQLLNQQLAMLQKENLKMRADLERELTTRQTLQLQVQSKDQLITSFKAQMEAGVLRSGNMDTMLKKSSFHDSGLMSGVFRRDAEDNGEVDPRSLDKSYWINRVGDLSSQLQQSSEYWSDKVKNLTEQVEHLRQSQPSPLVH